MAGREAELRGKTKCSKKVKNRKRKLNFLVIVFLIMVSCILLKNINIHKIFKNKNINSDLYNFMKDESSRESVYNEAIRLNNGSSANTCVYFVAEALRQNGEDIDYSICNTFQLLNVMEKDGWKKNYQADELKPGDICFTTDEKLNINGTPTHTYVFMGWVENGKHDYAYVCDNQAKDYKGNIYHVRNITKSENVKGNQKEPFSFFVYR